MTVRCLALANEWKVALFVQTEKSLEGKFKSSFLEMGVSDVQDIQVQISNKWMNILEFRREIWTGDINWGSLALTYDC